jgi:hypothetical protein
MKILHSLYRWVTLYFLVGIFFVALFWEENLQIDSFSHTLLAIGILLSFGYFLLRWVNHHETNFLVSQKYIPQSGHAWMHHFSEKINFSEKKQ